MKDFGLLINPCFWLPASGFWLLASGFWLLASGFWSGFWLPASGCQFEKREFGHTYAHRVWVATRQDSGRASQASMEQAPTSLVKQEVIKDWRLGHSRCSQKLLIRSIQISGQKIEIFSFTKKVMRVAFFLSWSIPTSTKSWRWRSNAEHSKEINTTESKRKMLLRHFVWS